MIRNAEDVARISRIERNTVIQWMNEHIPAGEEFMNYSVNTLSRYYDAMVEERAKQANESSATVADEEARVAKGLDDIWRTPAVHDAESWIDGAAHAEDGGLNISKYLEEGNA